MSDKIVGTLLLLLMLLVVCGLSAAKYVGLKDQVAQASTTGRPTFYPATFCVKGYVFVGVRMGGDGVDIEQVFEQYSGSTYMPMRCK